MKKILLVFSVVLLTAFCANAQVTQSSTGTQTSVSTNTGAKFYLSGCQTISNALSSEDLVIEKNVKIQQVTGNTQSGFWIEKNGTKVKDFASKAAAIGYVLPPGTYTAYPNLNATSAKSSNATVCVNIVLQ
jgi:hypothetical protein